MKKKIALLLILTLSLLAFTACGGGETAPEGNGNENENGNGESIVLKVGASSVPHAEILQVVKPILAEEGIDLQITEFTDYIIPNTEVESRTLDANYFQHGPYLENFNEKNGTHLISAVSVHYEPLGLYAGKTAAIADLKDGATIAVPNDPTNEARALLLLEQEGIIKLKEGIGLEATPNDIVENKLNITFFEAEAAAVARAVKDTDMAVINGNYALEAGLTADKALALESAESEGAQTFANIVAVYEGDESRPEIQALIKAITSDEVKAYIEEVI